MPRWFTDQQIKDFPTEELKTRRAGLADYIVMYEARWTALDADPATPQNVVQSAGQDLVLWREELGLMDAEIAARGAA